MAFYASAVSSSGNIHHYASELESTRGAFDLALASWLVEHKGLSDSVAFISPQTSRTDCHRDATGRFKETPTERNHFHSAIKPFNRFDQLVKYQELLCRLSS